MPIERLKIKNYRAIRSADIRFGEGANIIIGDNEAGKSTLLEAINLCLRCQINRRPLPYELHPFLINTRAVNDFIASHRADRPVAPPDVLIELFLKDSDDVSILRGSINSEKVDAPGVSLSIKLDEDFQEEYASYISDPQSLSGIPIEYYEVVWQSFAGATMKPRAMPIKSTLIDPSKSYCQVWCMSID